MYYGLLTEVKTMFINEYPYTDFNELNLDWILKTVRELQEKVIVIDDYATKSYVTEQLTELENKLVAMIELKLDKTEFNDFVSEIEMSLDSIAGAISQLQIDVANNAQAIIDTYNTLKDYIDSQLIDLQVINPFTGQTQDLQDVLNYMSNMMRDDSLTAEEYDNAQLTASAYDALQLTAYEYDNHGKQYIS